MMACICSCFQDKDPEEILDGPSHRNISHHNSPIHNFFEKYASFFCKGQMNAPPSSHQEVASSTRNGAAETILSPPTTLAFHSDLRQANMQWDGLVTGHQKGAGVLHSETQLRGNSIQIGQDLVTQSDCGEKSKKCHSDSPKKISLKNREAGYVYDHALQEEEDVCPTCLEEYTPENPKIVTHCSHHYHLSCIYEWMERSETCPVCCQVLTFDETK
ncbi:hypothetical protein ACB092_03G244800 [Castanea dentata]